MVVRSKAALKASAAFANPGWVMAITTSNSDTEKQKNRGEGVYIYVLQKAITYGRNVRTIPPKSHGTIELHKCN